MENAGSKQIKNSRIVFLDYLRIFAFLSVLIGHKFYSYVMTFSIDTNVHSTPRFIANLLLPVINGGGAGVVVFFLVSGYIITHVLQTENTAEFLIKRAFRIYPLYIVCVLIQCIILVTAGQTVKLSTLLPQLLLLGDFFGTPYALNGVEWTLRVEIVFYFFMAILFSVNLMNANNKILPYFFVATTVMCFFIAPIPSAEIWSKGYFTIYGPFLLLGSTFYIYEKKQIGLTFFLFFIFLIFYQYYALIATYQTSWLDAHFAIIAFFIFFLSWAFRSHLTASPVVLLLSDMTYSVYLFHNWFFDYAKKWLINLNVSVLNSDVQALIVLLLVCFLMMKYVEKIGIRFGRAMLTYVNVNKK